MKIETIKSEVEMLIPYALFVQGISIFILTVSGVLSYFWASMLFAYIFSFVAAVLSFLAGLNVKKKKRSAIIMSWIISLMFLLLPVYRPMLPFLNYCMDPSELIGKLEYTTISSVINNWIIVVFNFLIAIYLTRMYWKSWSLVKKLS